MDNDTILSRRLALARLGTIAAAAFAVPTILTATKSFANDSGGEGGNSGGGGDHESEHSGSDNSDNEAETETETETAEETDAVDDTPDTSDAPVSASDAKKKKAKKK